MNKRLNVSDDTMLHRTRTFKKGTGSKGVKNSFNFVINGFLISAVFVSSIVGGVGKADAMQFDKTPNTANVKVESQSVYQQDEVSMLSNLKMSLKVLDSAIKSGQLNGVVYENIMKRVVAIDTKIAIDGQFEKSDSLNNLITQADVLLNKDIEGVSQEVVAKRLSSIDALNNLKGSVGLSIKQVSKSDVTVPGSSFLERYPNATASSSVSDKTVTTSAVQVSQFKDFRSGQYWSEPMKWMISKNLIQGYYEKNPKTGQMEHLIKPRNTLTEAQFLAIMYRYTGVDKDIKSTNTKDWANIYYQQAARDGLPTVGTLKNRGAGNLPVVRGKMAQILVSKHYDKVVSERTAVDFMYKNKISDGYNIGGTNPKTYASFGVKDKLQRAHISAFFQRYDANVKNGGGTVVTPTPVTPPPVVVSPTPSPKPPTTGVVVNGISVKYGNHAYGSKSQAEYDTVVKMATDKINSYQIPANELANYQRVLNGERPVAGDWSYDNMDLQSAYDIVKPFLSLGLSNSEVLNILKLNGVATELNSGASDPLDGSPRSAYDAMVRKLSDCDPQSEIVNLVFDIAGYNTAIIAGTGHATPYVKIGGQWFDNAVKQVPTSTVQPSSGTYYMATPTHGGL